MKHINVPCREQYFEQHGFPDDPRTPQIPIKYQQFKLQKGFDSCDPTPWGLTGQQSPKQVQMNHSLFRTTPVRSRLQVRKRKNPEDKPEQLKMNSTFVEFRTTTSAINERKKKIPSIQTQIFQHKISSIPSGSQLEQNSKYDKIVAYNSLEKCPKIKFLERKFRLNFLPKNYSLSKRKKHRNNLNDTIFSIFDSRDHSSGRNVNQKDSKAFSNWHPMTVYRAYREGNQIRIKKTEFTP